MTTAVEVRTHAWNVEVRKIDPKTGDEIGTAETVPAGIKQTFHIHSGLAILVTEMPTEVKGD